MDDYKKINTNHLSTESKSLFVFIWEEKLSGTIEEIARRA